MGFIDYERNIYFDVGGVIFDFEARFKNMAQQSNVSTDEIKSLFRKYDDTACKGGVTTEELLKLYSTHIQFNPPINNFLNFWVSSFRINKEVHALIYELQRNYSIGLLTNIYKGVYENILSKGIIPKIQYSTVIKSCDLGIVKPDEAIYRIAEEKSQCLSNQILFIDDNLSYVDKAKSLGWNTCLFNKNDKENSVKEIHSFLSENRG